MNLTPSLRVLFDSIPLSKLKTLGVIDWGAPVPVFGSLDDSEVATVGLNPSNREFVNLAGEELGDLERRFHSLQSLEIEDWNNLDISHLTAIEKSCSEYFSGNPYDQWFRVLDNIISGTRHSFYNYNRRSACHLDLIPFATYEKWGDLAKEHQHDLMKISTESFIKTLCNSKLKLLILNGESVVRLFSDITNISLEKNEKKEWQLPRKSGRHVAGYSYRGQISKVRDIKLNRSILILGYNHNLQSSFGVTNSVKRSIRSWVKEKYDEQGI